jgi:hypothetical protein
MNIDGLTPHELRDEVIGDHSILKKPIIWGITAVTLLTGAVVYRTSPGIRAIFQ